MRNLKQIHIPAALLVAVAWAAAAQPPSRKPADAPDKERPKGPDSSALLARMMAFDKNKDGKLTRDEVTDPPLHRLFAQADTNKDGVVTRAEMEALAAKWAKAEEGGRRGFGPDDRGSGGNSGPSGPGDRGPGGRGGPGGRPQPRQLLAPFEQDRLKLTDKQKKQVSDLQKELDSKLGKILKDD